VKVNIKGCQALAHEDWEKLLIQKNKTQIYLDPSYQAQVFDLGESFAHLFKIK
jgi:site-specific DNA-adenine methylase